MTFVTRTSKSQAEQLDDKAAMFAACIGTSYGVFFLLSALAMFLLLVIWVIFVSLSQNKSKPNQTKNQSKSEELIGIWLIVISSNRGCIWNARMGIDLHPTLGV
jgi:uncharacterized membrane protein YhiD involved in acid resistance